MTRDEPLVTIVTPSYNQANFLEAAICSVLEQDYPNIEYFVIDGGSTDDSLNIIKKYSKHIGWWVSEKDSGQADAINKGLKRARGEFVAWLNSDDLYQSGAISSAVDAFQANSQAAVVYGDAWSVNAEGSPFNFMKSRQYTLVDLLAFCIITQPAAFMRRSVLVSAGYLDPIFHYILDHHLWIRMARLAPVVYIPQTWASARYHEQAKNRRSSDGFVREAAALMEDLQKDPQYSDIITGHERYIFAGVNRFKAFYLTESGKSWEALGMYAKSFWLYPAVPLHDWKHVIYAGLSLLSMKKLRGLYEKLRAWRIKEK